MIARIYHRLASLSLGLWLMLGVILLLAAGSFMGQEGAEALNELPLLVWLSQAPIAISWWLWGAILLLALLALNTVLCSIEAVRGRVGQTSLLRLMAPQMMHLGFLLVMLAHFMSSYGSVKQTMVVREGMGVTYPDGRVVEIGPIEAQTGPMGFVTDFEAKVRVKGEAIREETIRPNHPFFFGGYGMYIKEAAKDPIPAALMEIHREPGAPWALAGAIIFSVGNVALLAVRRGRA